MKIFKITLLAALISAPLSAAEIDKTWELGVFGDYIKSATGKETSTEWQGIEAGKGLGIDLQMIISEDWRARIELAKTRYEINNGNDTDYGTRYGIDAIYKVDKSDFYVFAGVKRFDNTRDYTAVNLGAGYDVNLSERFTLYGEAAAYRDVTYGETDTGFKLGLKYAFGDVKKAPVATKPATPEPAPVAKAAPVVAATAAVNDKDNDGVVDAQDNCNDTAANVKVDSKGCTLYSEETAEINLNVAFANNSSVITLAMMSDIQRLADFMMTYQDTNVVIEGHSSAQGNDQYNLTLSQKRADAIKNTLISKYGISANRLTAIGYGETKLLSTGNSSADHKQNRRVIAVIETEVIKPVIKN
ncbi:OmpA family protein [Colwellia echini]|uniref:OmpA family protein n=1 Tax=Colwellia echini TaxID=1982103 RepID=A0ABY3MXC0_9GAMM|nr:OmpA family protein [Colwellia echini]TYK65841.1 OmpA family protein [Colwellia echini]